MMDGTETLSCAQVLGSAAAEPMQRARDFLARHSTEELLGLVGQTLKDLALTGTTPDKRSFPAGYGGGGTCDDDLLAGAGMFYITQTGKLMLDCTSGHYQMTWGYNHPQLTAALIEATKLGVVWDNHANIPSLPVKLLAEKLTALAGGTGLDRVLLGVCTGSVACGAALKIMLTRYFNDPARAGLGPPVMVTLVGNYHGTDIVAQTMRGMWPGLLARLETVQIEPNDPEGLKAAFGRYRGRVAGFWAEPIMMNCEAVPLEKDFLQLARELCTENGALMALDEIQTCFWYPEVFMFRGLDLKPDLVVVGKGMTAGFHPLAGLLYRSDLDILEQYDAISTNGNASLAAFVSLCNLQLIEREHDRLARLAQRHYGGLCALADEFPDLIERANGRGLLTGLKFRERRDALGFHRAALGRGLWLRVHAYHAGHRTVLMKYPLIANETIVDYVFGVMRELLQGKPWR